MNWQNGLQLGMGLLNIGSAAFMRSCFASGTPLRCSLTESKPIDRFRVGDLILSRSENALDGPLALKTVEEVFVRLAKILNLHLPGHVIRTTAEHPFFVYDRGWLPAGSLHAGDLLASHDGQWMAVEGLLDTGEFETVYNLRVADFHTYFVGGEDWGFSVWAHNATYEPNPKHGQQSRGTAKGVSSPEPTNGQVALDNSIQIKPTSPRRVGVDAVNGELVVLDQHLPDLFHGHVRSWDELTSQMQNALRNAGLVGRKGNIL